MIFKKIRERILHRETLSERHVLALFSFIFIFWAVYRYFPECLPTWVEELILKPIIWLIPTFWVVKKIEKNPLSSLGLTKKNLFPALYWGIGLGIVFAFEGLLANIFKYGGLNTEALNLNPGPFLGSLVLSLATAFSEETLFRGFIFSRLRQIRKNEIFANLISALLFVVIHLPVSVFVLGYSPGLMLVYLMLVFIFGIGSAFVFARTGNLISSISLHVFWSWPIILFK
jgi:hypothetical protein